jgi:pimeloyl-ACP methyl ester carboxylesterase
VTIERVRSAARGRSVDLITVLPDDLHQPDLPVCLMLHGRLSSAHRTLAGGAMTSFLARATEQGQVPPFAFVAVDGGNTYWHSQPDGDDPMAMLLDEVPRWLAERGLGGPDAQPFACAGVSMGGFGALVYARRRRERGQPLRAVAGISPALFLTWAVMSKRRAFTNAAEWAALDPHRHLNALGNLPVGVWCGTEDHLCIDGTRQFIREAKPVVASLTHGGHDEAFYRKALPDVIRFVGGYLPRPSPASVAPSSG